jgi:hypothetical protein
MYFVKVHDSLVSLRPTHTNHCVSYKFVVGRAEVDF